MAQPNIPFTPATTSSTSPAFAAAEMLPTEIAFEQTLPEIHALREDDLIAVNLDVMTAITTVTGVLPEIRALRPEIEIAWRSFDFAQFDKLEQYTLALNHAHSCHRSSVSKESIAGLVNELNTLRDQLLANASSLATLHLLNVERLKNVKKATGYRALASDVLTLCTVYNDAWAQVAGKTPFTQADLMRIGTLALDLVNALGLRDQAPVMAGQAAMVRQRAFTLFLRAYDEARRAVHYLRDKAGDGDRIAPSLYAGRGNRRRNDDTEEPTPPTPATSTGKGPAGSSTAASPASEPALPIVIDNTANLPIDHPFAS